MTQPPHGSPQQSRPPYGEVFAATVGPVRRTGLWLALGAMTALTVVLVVVVTLVRDDSGGPGDPGGPGPREVVVAFMKAAENGEFDEATTYLCEELAKEHPVTQGPPSESNYQVGEATIDGNEAEVPLEFEKIESGPQTVILILHRTDGDWKICDVTPD